MDNDSLNPLVSHDTAIFAVLDVNLVPVLIQIPAQTIDEGGIFATILLDNYVYDAETPDDKIQWSFEGNSNLVITVNKGVAAITIPDVNWFGQETIIFKATDDDDSNPLFASVEVIFSVLAVNDAPVLADIPDMNIKKGQTFANISLNNYVEDVETADENIIWSFTGNSKLDIVINNGVASITVNDANWIGSETVSFTATDDDEHPLSDSDNVTFTVESGTSVNEVNSKPVIQVFPNPASGLVYIAIPDRIEENVVIRVINSLGQTVKVERFEFIHGTVELNLDDLSTGVYILEISLDSGISSYRLILDK
jgi:hypothetical protein